MQISYWIRDWYPGYIKNSYNLTKTPQKTIRVSKDVEKPEPCALLAGM